MPDPPEYGFRAPDFPPPQQYSAQALTYGMPPTTFHPAFGASVEINPVGIPSHSDQEEHKIFCSNTSSSSSSSSHSCEHVEGVPVHDFTLYPPSGYCWQMLSSDDTFPEQHAVRAGRDQDGDLIYVGRAFHEGNMIPAKVIPAKRMAFVSHAGGEHPKDDFEILRKGDFVWEFAANGHIPENAVEIGRSSDGEKLYMGRCLYEGSQTPGKIQPSHGCLYIPFNGEEISIQEYEVLLVK